MVSTLLTLASVASQHVPNLRVPLSNSFSSLSTNSADAALGALPDALHFFPLAKRDDDHPHGAAFVVSVCLIPVLVLLSGLFAGLTLGYMSLDETQLNVLSISGTPEQKLYANKIKPIRKDGHLLLVTLLLANMIVNETLPVIADPVLGGGLPSVIVSTVLIVIFSEIIPQSLCTRYGLYFGAKMAGLVRVLLWTLGLIAWPIAKLLEFVLGPHHGIIYRRTELKELIAMHSSAGEHGGDLKKDTVTIIGGALDLQEKVVKQAMTPIEDVFMLSIDAKLDYATLRQVCLTGHSRIPVYEEIEVPVSMLAAIGVDLNSKEFLDNVIPDVSNYVPGVNGIPLSPSDTRKVKKIIGILLVKQCVLLDPKDATPVRKIALNKVPFVPNNEPLLGILDTFQEGRSHMAIVSRFSVTRAASVKKAVKRGLTQRLRDRVRIGDSDSNSSSDSESEKTDISLPKSKKRYKKSHDGSDTDTTRGSEKEDSDLPGDPEKHSRGGKSKAVDIEMGDPAEEKERNKGLISLTLPKSSFGRFEQSMPADAVLTEQGADEFLQGVDPAVMPLGIITLEDVLEELIGEEIYDEFDPQGHPILTSYGPNEPKAPFSMKRGIPAVELSEFDTLVGSISQSTLAPIPYKPIALPALRNINFKGLTFARSRSAPPVPREVDQEPPSQSPPSNDLAFDEAVHPMPQSSPDLDEAAIYPLAITRASTPGDLEEAPSEEQLDRPSLKPSGTTLSVPTIRAPVPVPAAVTANSIPPTIRGTSASPSFEHAILVERMRRVTSGAPSGPGPKGARYKSSPLTGDRLGVVVAEKVKQEMPSGGGCC